MVPSARTVKAQEAVADGDETDQFIENTDESRAAMERGLEYLASQQTADGSFSASHYGKNVAVTALACLAFMSNGDLPGRGRYGPQVERGVDFVLNHVHPTGLIAADTSHGPMYGHGFATLLLGEIYGQTNDPRVRESLIKAVRLIVGAQNPEGGWRYQPQPFDADLSVTICQIMALRSARNAGIKVPTTTIDKAIEYVRKSQNSDGGFRYMLGSSGSAFPRSAAGVAALYYAGVYQDATLEKGLAYLLRHKPGKRQDGGHYFYGQYYAVQAMYLAGGTYWRTWYPAIRNELLRRQNRADGSWQGSAGPSYGTAMALIILHVPHRYLPIFER
ncbi:MAG: prenyltransferase [Planctomycetaceae bacterium]|nr:prenyltransferase [Planctomycetaceae bacterium]